MYRRLLMEKVCELTEIPFDPRCIPKTDNFAAGYQDRLKDMDYCDLEVLLRVFYNDGFKYPESTFCEGYGKLVDFVYLSGSPYAEEIVEELDEITVEDAFRDENGELVSDDNRVRYLRCLNTMYDLYTDSKENEEQIMSIECFEREKFDSMNEILKYLSICDEEEKEELLTEWKAVQENGTKKA